MNIAINTSFGAKGDMIFQLEVLKKLTSAHQEHEFIVFTEAVDTALKFTDNVQLVKTGVSQSYSFLSKWRRDTLLNSLLRKNRAAILISCTPVCSLQAGIPQFMLAPAFGSKEGSGRLLKNNRPYARKAIRVFTPSELLKKKITDDLDLASEKIEVIRGAAIESFHPIDENAKESIRQAYTVGRNYFIYTGPTKAYNDLIMLLKAFSVFKKRQKSDWKLLFAGKYNYDKLEKSLSSYKHREDVVILKDINPQQLLELTAAAYAYIDPTTLDVTGSAALSAMRSGIPVVAAVDSAIGEIAKNSALFIKPGDYLDIADKIMLLYKDELLRSALITKAMEIEEHLTWEKTANQVWESIIQHSGIKNNVEC